MHSKNLHLSEIFLRLTVGLLLWGISAILTISLFLNLAGDNLGRKILMAILAVALEGAKILSWRMGGRAKFLAFALIALSGFASLGAALQTVENAKSSFMSMSLDEIMKSESYKSLIIERMSIDTEIATIIDRIKKLPPDFSTAARTMTSSLQVLRDRREKILESMTVIEAGASKTYNNSNMFVLMGRTIGQPPENVLLILLIFLAASIEAGALLLTAPGKVAKPSEELPAGKLPSEGQKAVLYPSYTRPIGPEEFLRAAMQGSDLPFLHGRDKTAQKLGVRPYEAKRLVRELIECGLVVADGKRLRMTDGRGQEGDQAEG